jgi:hypothetical protein
VRSKFFFLISFNGCHLLAHAKIGPPQSMEFVYDAMGPSLYTLFLFYSLFESCLNQLLKVGRRSRRLYKI